MGSSFYIEWARLLKSMVDLMRFRTEPYINDFIKNQREIDLMAWKLNRMNIQDNENLKKMKKGFLISYKFIYDRLLPAMGYGDIQPLIPILNTKPDSSSSMDNYSKKL